MTRIRSGDSSMIDDLLELSCGGGASQTLSRVLNLDQEP